MPPFYMRASSIKIHVKINIMYLWKLSSTGTTYAFYKQPLFMLHGFSIYVLGFY